MGIIDEIKGDSLDNNETLSFEEYFKIFKDGPRNHCRHCCTYLLDMFEHFGFDEKKRSRLFQMEHDDAPAIQGQFSVQKDLLTNLDMFQEEGFNNKFVLLVGPNGSSKSSIVKKIMKGAEAYSETGEGALYTFSWIFPIDSYVKGSLGLGSENKTTSVDSFAHLEDKDIAAIVNSELKDHPLLLIPLKKRQKIINEMLGEWPAVLASVKKSYLYLGDIDKRNRMIFDALLKSYKGDYHEVYRHIRVERFTLSRRYSVGAVTIEPQLHVDARMQQITMDKRLAALPPSLQSLNLYSIQGETVSANRGILEFSDLLKRPLDTFKYLLMTMETKNINLQGILTELDIFFVGTSNEIHLAAFRQHPDYNSFRGRFNFIRVPYLLSYVDEEKIYTDQLDGLGDKSIFEPHALRALSLFTILSRVRAPQASNYSDSKLGTIASGLSPMEKILFLGKGILPSRLDSESKQILKHSLEEIEKEFTNDQLYEGKFGLSPRDVKRIIYDLADSSSINSFVNIHSYLEKLLAQKNEYEFLNITPQGDYHHPARFLALIKEHILNIFDSELRGSLGLVDDRSYEDYIKKYIGSINSLIKGEKVKNSVTGSFEKVDTYFIDEFEKGLKLTEDKDSYRRHLLSTLGAYSLDNPGEEILYTEVFPDVIDKLQDSFREEQKKLIKVISNNLVYYQSEIERDEEGKQNGNPMSEDSRQLLRDTVGNLVKTYGYSEMGAIELMRYIIKEKY